MVFKKHDTNLKPFKWSVIFLSLFLVFSVNGKDTGDGGYVADTDDHVYDDGGYDDDDGGKGGGGGKDTVYVEKEPKVVYRDRVIYKDSCSYGKDDDGLSYCDSSHRHYSNCGHDGYGRDRDRDRISEDDWRRGDRDDRSCYTSYDECSRISCYSRMSEFRACEDEMSRRRKKNYGRDGADCYDCNKSTYAENVRAWTEPLAYLGGTLGSAYLNYRGVKAQADASSKSSEYWANAFENGYTSCIADINAHRDYTITRGSDPLLSGQVVDQKEICNGIPIGGQGNYAGMQGYSGSMYGGIGNPWINNGFSSGFLGGMAGPYGGAGGGLSAGINIGFGAGLGGGATSYPGYPGYGGYVGHYGQGAYPGYGSAIGGGVTIGGSAGLGNYGGVVGGYPGMTGGMYQSGWNPYGGASSWGNSGGWSGNQYWQGQNQQYISQQQNYQSSAQFANSRNVANYMTGNASSQSLWNNYNQAASSYGLGMQSNPSGYYGSTPYNMGAGMHGNFTYGSQYGYNRPY